MSTSHCERITAHFIYRITLVELDGVGPVDNRPSAAPLCPIFLRIKKYEKKRNEIILTCNR